jgi:hypothetical protein
MDNNVIIIIIIIIIIDNDIGDKFVCSNYYWIFFLILKCSLKVLLSAFTKCKSFRCKNKNLTQ